MTAYIEKPACLQNSFYQKHGEILVSSYQKLVGEGLLEAHSCQNSSEALIDSLWNASVVVVSHGVEDDPIFNFANKVGLSLFGYGFDEFVTLPSRLSAEPVTQVERNALLSETKARGFIDNYSGVRISKMGQRFLISEAKVLI
ncbi:MEKHLA domain-containing protein [Veronia nyctiphanis]|uniref:MEKHLA domain-containing protein n=1 Tax=Veronia nyctiphanis TaxID=1278244 RepID=A0A4Q0YKB9_9GAMM|nr:MEKHLA domain-containing protein [Veronia nyctiphanis]RXJ70414.1 MEKHLA domain-containing protein [Veronia nyctiphanis]